VIKPPSEGLVIDAPATGLGVFYFPDKGGGGGIADGASLGVERGLREEAAQNVGAS
jgi:hypothetical protein